MKLIIFLFNFYINKKGFIIDNDINNIYNYYLFIFNLNRKIQKNIIYKSGLYIISKLFVIKLMNIIKYIINNILNYFISLEKIIKMKK